jgi:hypothetical protein
LKRLDGQHGPVVGHSKIFVPAKKIKIKMKNLADPIRIDFLGKYFFKKVRKIIK